ncbi:syntaxin-112 [Cynara cardunculus var. scolymus]|uniref:Syntaxin, N-terminal n=1 Tax=Cynara cardunculus var. scolymus TaxID=59895 RepID=A0A124SFC7_CYNCS|nr:syntaxin-112 [Cynara cardunculus var. scolymus]KVI02852.1 Syntaxin, N-terminal [Cynara cardunculus var. scolymus]
MNDLMTKSFLSYVELKKQTRIDIKSEETDIEKGNQEQKIAPSDETNLSNFFQEVDVIKSNMEEITNLLFDLQTLNEETKSAHSAKVLRGLRDRMESDMVSVLRKANVVRVCLESLDNSNESNRSCYKEGSAVDRTRVAVSNGLRVKLKEMMNDFQDLRNKIVSDHKEYLKKRYYNETGEYPDEATIGTMVSGSGKVFEGKKDLVLENKERHEAVMDIKKSLNKLHQVFLDMAVLVEAQGQNLDDIELNVARAGSFVSGGTDSLFYAKQMKDKHSKNWVCFVLSVIIIICLVCFIAMLSSF